jgi:hypothetical protein
MSALGQKRTLVSAMTMSALCQKRTHAAQRSTWLFDYLIGSHQHCSRHCQTECFQSVLVNREMEAGGLLEGQIGGTRSF